MHLILPPMEHGGRLFLNLARTTPLVPCDLVTLPHEVLYTVPFFFVFAL
jgi:hypothetical protein